MRAVFDALESLGFGLREARPESKPGGLFSTGLPFVQEFEYVPRSGPYRGEFDELEVVFEPTETELGVLLEVDRRGGFLAEISDLDIDERFDRLDITTTDSQGVERQLRDVLDRHT